MTVRLITPKYVSPTPIHVVQQRLIHIQRSFKTTCPQLSLHLLSDLIIFQSHKIINWESCLISLSQQQFPNKICDQSFSVRFLNFICLHLSFQTLRIYIIASGLVLYQTILHGAFGEIFLKYENYHVSGHLT